MGAGAIGAGAGAIGAGAGAIGAAGAGETGGGAEAIGAGVIGAGGTMPGIDAFIAGECAGACRPPFFAPFLPLAFLVALASARGLPLPLLLGEAGRSCDASDALDWTAGFVVFEDVPAWDDSKASVRGFGI